MNKDGGETTAKRLDQQKVTLYKLFSFADQSDVVLMTVGTISGMANGCSRPLMTVMLGKTINKFGSTDQSQIQVVHVELGVFLLVLLYLAVASGIAGFLQTSSWMVTGARQANRIRSLYLDTILRQDIGFFDTETTTGEVIGRMSGDTILIQDAMGEKVGKFIQLVSNFIGAFVFAFIIGWRLTLVLLPTVPLIIIAGAAMAAVISKMSSYGQVAYAEAGNVVEQTIGAIRTVAAFTGEKHAMEKYNRRLKVAYAATVKQGLASGFGVGVALLIVFLSYALAIWYGSKLIIEKGYDGGKIVNVLFCVIGGGMALGQASPCLSAFGAGQAAAYKMFETIKRKPKINAYDTNGVVLEEIMGEIELKDVYFKYPARPEVQIFSGFSLNIPSGTTAALVGQSGSGKSTVISLLERFYDPEAGEVLIDGVNLKKINLRWIRGKIGLVSQEPILFAATIKENISYGKEKATDEEIRTAIKLANAAKFIDKMPTGLDTMVGEHGTQLSGGQKQRIAIARAILKNPRILLLDEATSALDAESERIVQDALQNIMVNRTTVIVAHRLTTIRNADNIAVVHQGKIVEQGTHMELIRDPDGAYSQLVRLQEGHNQVEDAQSRVNSPSVHHSYSLSSGIPDPTGIIEMEFGGKESSTTQGEAENRKRRKVSLIRLAYLNKPETPVLLLGSIAAGFHGIIYPVFGLLISTAIKIFYEPPNELKKDSRVWAFMFIGLGVLAFIALPLQNYLFGIAGGKLIQRICSLSFEKVVHQEISWFDDPANSSGSVGARLSTDASTVRSLVGDTLALVVQNLVTVAAGLVISFTANWILALIILAVLPLMGFQGYLQTRFLKGFSADAKVMYEEASQVANDAVSSIRTVASFCAEKKVMEMYQQKCEGPMKHGVRLGLVSGAGLGFSFFSTYCTNAFCFYIGAVLVQHGKATFSEVFKVYFALTFLALAISEATAMAPDTNKAKDSTASIFELLDSKPKIDSSSNEGTTLSIVKGDIELQNVSFRYSTRPDVQIFRDLCLSIPSGKTVALVGESGSGKSTVISLLERFYNPDSGHILLDGMEIQKFKLSWLRQQMGLVNQEPALFNETIRANIAYGKQGEAAEEEIIAATRAANAHNFISALPQGYDTSVGERGLQLSGGQKQRIAIARAILKDPRILLLDEATSALDAESERVVQDALDRVMVDRTTVVVAHRLTTIKGADVIAVVKNGEIAEKGTHDVLMDIRHGAYASLVALHMASST
uniref:ABC transporter B family member 9 n=1 Tax=Vitis vinifera TaxID=29760 RepID=F6HMG3_VITVI